MHRFFRPTGVLLAVLTAVAVACSDDVGPAEVENFTATINAAQEEPTNASTATGTATISVVGGVLVYRIDVAGISNAVAAHIHAPAIAGVNAGVVVNLCGTGAPAPGCAGGANFTGVLAAGVATQVTGMSFDRLLTILRTDSAYVNIHTNDGVAPTGTGPGDLSAGEIRGQIERQ